MPPPAAFAAEPDLSAADFVDVLDRSGLAAIRPVHDRDRIAAMLAGAGLIVTARERDGRLVGVARCVTDFAWCCYLSELAVCRSVQGRGVGRGLLDETRRRIGPRVSLVLASVPGAAAFYEGVGMERLADGFLFKRAR